MYGDTLKFKESEHLKKIVEGIYNNMGEDQPIPVKFYAASALKQILSIDEAKELIKPGLE